MADVAAADERSREERAASVRRRLAVIQMELASLASALERARAEAAALGIVSDPGAGSGDRQATDDLDPEPDGWWSVMPMQTLATMAGLVIVLAIALALIG